jgi:hypothetical protein
VGKGIFGKGTVSQSTAGAGLCSRDPGRVAIRRGGFKGRIQN